jgi:predicted glutamine amidotransferase
MIKEQAGIGEAPSYFNMMITDGERIFGTRYSSDPADGVPTLYYATGARYSCTEDGVSHMADEAGEGRGAVLIVSEKLTERSKDWIPIPENHFIAVEKDLQIELLPLS